MFAAPVPSSAASAATSATAGPGPGPRIFAAALEAAIQRVPPKMLAAVIVQKMTDKRLDDFDAGWREAREARKRKQDLVYRMVCLCIREEGLQRDEIAQRLNGLMSKKEVDGALDFLCGEGLIYSTIDDDHFKAIDG